MDKQHRIAVGEAAARQAGLGGIGSPVEFVNQATTVVVRAPVGVPGRASSKGTLEPLWRVFLPPKVRALLRLEPGDYVFVLPEPNGLRLRRAPGGSASVRLIDRQGRVRFTAAQLGAAGLRPGDTVVVDARRGRIGLHRFEP